MKRLAVLFALAASLALSACQTFVVSSHGDLSAGRPAFARPLAVVNFSGYASGDADSEQLRRAGEMELVNSLADMNVVASYRFFSLDELADIGDVKRRASAEGFDGLVLVWVTGVRTEEGSENSWLDLRVSAAAVSLPEGREVWSGVIERRNYEGERMDARAIARAVARRIKSDGLSD